MFTFTKIGATIFYVFVLELEAGNDEPKAPKSSNIIRLSAIRDVISTGKHALLDITPNAVERLNYAQLYPIVVFFKADTKIIIKQLRQGLPKYDIVFKIT